MPQLTGTPQDDVLIGDARDDQIFGLEGADTINGGDGTNEIYGGPGGDLITGGSGTDFIRTFEYWTTDTDRDVVDAGGGNDVVWFGVGDDADGGTGQDSFYFYLTEATGPLTIDFTLLWQGQAITIGGGTIRNFEAIDIFYATPFDDVITVGGTLNAGPNIGLAWPASISGWHGDDTIYGGYQREFLSGGTGNDSIYGAEGNDGIQGEEGDDYLDGGDGDDYIFAGSGADTVYGGPGNDWLYPTTTYDPDLLADPDVLSGGDGSDQIFAGYLDTLDGGSGYDVAYLNFTGSSSGLVLDFSNLASSGSLTIDAVKMVNIEWIGGFHATPYDDIVRLGAILGSANGGAGHDIIFGTARADAIDGGSGDDHMYGGNGNDSFTVDSVADLIFENSGEGIDQVTATSSFYLHQNVENLTLASGSGDNFGVGNALANTIIGNESANLLIAGDGADALSGGGGGDSLFGEGGADRLNGDAGIDYLVGGLGNDSLYGGADADALYGEDGDDYLNGGTSFDTDIMVGGAGNDTLYAVSGQANPDYDLIDGGAGDDTYWVDTGADLTFEAIGDGIDTVHANVTVPNAGVYLYANVENLILEGTTAFGVGNELDNVLTGSASGNWLLGGDGNDTINGMGGNDVLYGEAGNDTFVFGLGNGGDVIGDFTSGQDHIQLNGQYANFAELQTHFVQNGNVGAIDLGGGNLIVLHNVTMSDLAATDFIFG